MSVRSAVFVPPHCPRSDCRFHDSAIGWRWIRHGSFVRQGSPQRIPRFRCGHCGHTFSSQTFSTSYWLKRPEVLAAVAFPLLPCSGYPPMAREARCSPRPLLPHATRRARGRRGADVRPDGTSSPGARTAGNPLSPVNRLDVLLRHNSANHKRETIAFSKRHQSVVERAAWLVLWQNWSKRFSERHGGGTPAMRLGLADRPIPLREILRERVFATRIKLPALWSGYYRGEVPTRRIRNEQRLRLKLAG